MHVLQTDFRLLSRGLQGYIEGIAWRGSSILVDLKYPELIFAKKCLNREDRRLLSREAERFIAKILALCYVSCMSILRHRHYATTYMYYVHLMPTPSRVLLA